MPSPRHPPPPPLTSLLDVKRGHALSRRTRRLAYLRASTLELRLQDAGPVEWAVHLHGAVVTPRESGWVIVVVKPAEGVRLRIFAGSEAKFRVWHDALVRAAGWKFRAFYGVVENGEIAGGGIAGGVFRALALDGGDSVAVKFVKGAGVRAAREARIARLLRHEGVVNVLDVFEAPEGLYVVMEHFPLTLGGYCDTVGGVVSERIAAHIVACLLRALSYMHDRNVVHRDLHPENILVAPGGAGTLPRVVVCDFGDSNFADSRMAVVGARRTTAAATDAMARRVRFKSDATPPVRAARSGSVSPIFRARKRASDAAPLRRAASDVAWRGVGTLGPDEAFADADTDAETDPADSDHEDPRFEALFSPAFDGFTMTSAVGTPAYTAPEVRAREPYGTPVDVWGCGVILYNILSGALPFTPDDTLCTVLDFAAPRWSAVSPPAKALVRAMLNPDPRRRISVESALTHAWLTAPPDASPGTAAT